MTDEKKEDPVLEVFGLTPTEDTQNVGPLLSALKVRRLGVSHWTEHDFEMERIGRAQSAKTYRQRLDILEHHGWKPFGGPFYYGNQEFHGGHTPPWGKSPVPTKVAFAMFRESYPDVELPEYKPHPHGWKPPKSTEGLFDCEITSIEPMKVPSFKLLDMKDNFPRDTELDNWSTFCKQFEGVRYCGKVYLAGGKTMMSVTVEDEQYVDQFPGTWQDYSVEVKVKPAAVETAERQKRKERDEIKLRHEREWLRKAGL